MAEQTGPWGRFPIQDGTVYRSRIGPLTVYLRREDGDWYVADQHDPEGISLDPTAPVPETEAVPMDWTRWVSDQNDPNMPGVVEIAPALPDKPVVVRPSGSFNIPAGVDVTLYFAVPVWVSIKATEPRPAPLVTVPTVILSNTWFGDPGSGELGYVLRVDPSKNHREVTSTPWQALCPLTIRNISTDELAFERFSLQTDSLGIWSTQNHLWTDGVTVSFPGPDKPAQVHSSSTAPAGFDNAIRLSPPREGQNSRFFRRSFSLIRSFGGLLPGSD